MKKLTGVLVGLVLVACGILYLLGAFGIADIHFSLDGWWTLFIIIPCLSGLLTGKDKFGSAIGLLVGVLLLLAAQDFFEYSMVWKVLAPVIVVMIGVKIIAKSLYTPNEHKAETEQTKHVAVCSEQVFDDEDEELTAAQVGAVFGGAKYNLTDANIKDGSQINLMCVFGGAEIIVPENVNIKCNTFCLFGGINDKRTIKPTAQENITLNINGFCIFGGADIK